LIYGKIKQKQELFPKPGIKSGDQSRKYVTYVAGYFTDNIAEIKRFVMNRLKYSFIMGYFNLFAGSISFLLLR
jgi:hypothetical protein